MTAVDHWLQPHVTAAWLHPGEQDNSRIKLNTNECPIGPSPRCGWRWRRSSMMLCDSIQTRLAPPYDRRQALLPAGQVMAFWFGNGSDDCLTILGEATLAPTATVATPTPTYGLYQVLSDIQGATLQAVPYENNNDAGDADTDAWTLPVDGLIAAQAPLTVIANPNNPSGSLADIADLRRLLAASPASW